MQCIRRMKHNEYLTLAQSNIILSHNWIETNIHYIKDGIVRTNHENIKLINGEASSTTLVEELASHDKRIIKKLIKLLKSKYLQKNWSSKLKKPKKTWKRPRTAPPAQLRTFTIEMSDIYKLILGF